MSIYIKGMEMPKPGQEISIAENWDGAIYARLEPLGDWCPLVELPPHGRLIDADALKNKHHWTDDFYETEYVEVEDIDTAPTIIPASGGDEA